MRTKRLTKKRLGVLLLSGALVGSPALFAWAETREEQLERRVQELEAKLKALPAVSAAPGSIGDAIPDARPGQCFAKVLAPAKYETVKEKVLVSEASSRIEIEPAQFEWVEERVQIKPATHRLEVVPAKYETAKETIELEPARTVWRSGKSARAPIASSTLVTAATKLGLPPAPKAGQCYEQWAQQAQFETKEQKVLISEASSKLTTSAPEYEWVEEKVLVTPASERLVEVPAKYETVTEKVLQSPATKVWKKGRGPIEKIEDSTGEILCLVEVPAKYREVKKRVLKTPATTQRVEVPAKYKTMKVRKLKTAAKETRKEIPAEYTTLKKRVKVKDAASGWRLVGSGGAGKATGTVLCGADIAAKTKTVSKRVLKAKPETRKIEIPAEFKTVRVQKLKAKAASKKIGIPAKYKELTQRKKVSDEILAWRPVLCETNASATLVTDIQRALQRAGFNPGKIDGVVGRQTLEAVDSYQKANKLARGGLTLATIERLGVSPR